ncbi:MAG: preprotein translocase subunit SecA [Dehalococcoidales bacterium]|nr:preprotein translocase subunit SecA [Dehalococcoidales bacterium]
MFKWLGGLGDSNEKELKRLQPLVSTINQLEPEFEKLSDAELRAKTDEFKARLKNGSSLDELLPEAFAAVREAARRTIGQRHFDVQLLGGVVLHQGKITEMKTGEGKTLVATLPLYLNSLTGQGCHLVTVNDYLARRDPYWMGPIYHALGVSVASIYPMQNPDEHTPSRLYDPDFDSGDSRWVHFRSISRREAYQADITYGASSEFGFDYLRDNMVMELSQCVQRPLNYAIVDEVDYLLIDEARTPLIISAPDVEAGQRYQIFARLIPGLKKEADYTVDEKTRAISLTEVGMNNMERMLKREGLLKAPNLYDPANSDLHRYLRNALNAKELYKKDREYVVKDGQVIIVDDFTGRLMYGRRYSEGLHQAIEAKERVKVQHETRTFATITIQNYFRMYDKLAGMTGTALTEAEEFHKIYSLDVVVIPTHQPMIRQDFTDQIYKDEKAKFRAVVREIEQLHKENRPVLIGTVSIENSEYLSDLLKKKGIPYEVLNAKQHEREANIVAQAGEPGAVTVATNMAGRGVDIILGGTPEGQDESEWQEKHNKVVALGGLHIIGTERHEARRIDNQLRGRSGRQGDAGSSRFYVSLEDEVVHRFGGDRIKSFMEWAGMDEDTPIENRLVSRSIESAQVRVEGYHFDMRKHLVEYDDVINKHRELIYDERKKILGGADLKSNILSMVREEIQGLIAVHTADEHGIGWNTEGLIGEASTIFPLPPALDASALSQLKPKQIEDRLIELAEALYEEREKELGSDNMRILERLVMLRTIDNLWVDHLTDMEHMRQGIGLQATAQRDPLVAYKREGHNLFQSLLSTIQHDVAHTVYRVGIAKREVPQRPPTPVQAGGGGGKKRLKVGGKKVGRNDPCPCGSGKKYKHCCGR